MMMMIASFVEKRVDTFDPFDPIKQLIDATIHQRSIDDPSIWVRN